MALTAAAGAEATLHCTLRQKQLQPHTARVSDYAVTL